MSSIQIEKQDDSNMIVLRRNNISVQIDYKTHVDSDLLVAFVTSIMNEIYRFTKNDESNVDVCARVAFYHERIIKKEQTGEVLITLFKGDEDIEVSDFYLTGYEAVKI